MTHPVCSTFNTSLFDWSNIHPLPRDILMPIIIYARHTAMQACIRCAQIVEYTNKFAVAQNDGAQTRGAKIKCDHKNVVRARCCLCVYRKTPRSNGKVSDASIWNLLKWPGLKRNHIRAQTTPTRAALLPLLLVRLPDRGVCVNTLSIIGRAMSEREVHQMNILRVAECALEHGSKTAAMRCKCVKKPTTRHSVEGLSKLCIARGLTDRDL